MAIESLPGARSLFASRIAEGRKLLWLPGVAAIIGALVTAVVTFAILQNLTPIVPNRHTNLLLAAVNAAFILILVGLIVREAIRILQARQQARAASRLHVRIVTLFALVAAIPAIMVAIFASIQLNIGLDRWFEIRTKTIINYSLDIAERYVQENARSIQNTTLSMASALDVNRQVYNLDRNGFLEMLTVLRQRGAFAHAALIGPDGSSIMAARTNADFPMPEPPPGAVGDAAGGEPVLIQPVTRNIIGAIVKLKQFDDTYLYTIRTVDPEVIRAQQIVRANFNDYDDMESNRAVSQAVFALPYLLLTLIIVLSSIWTGIAVADRLVRPIRQLIGASDEVATGNLDVQVPVRNSDGDVGHLSSTFNNMLLQLKSQRNELLTAKDQIDDRRRFSEAVLAGVSSGVIGVDSLGTVTIVNKSAEQILGLPSNRTEGKNLSVLLPQIGKVFEVGRRSGKPVYREQVTFMRGGAERSYNVQVTTEAGSDQDKSYVVTIDDITDLVQAQRSSAWADVARRIAHEIKNPLTPIQLSAERIRRRYGKVITEDREVFDQCTDTIIRQVEDIGRMVDEFSAFARMPKPEMKVLDLREPLREASFLVEVSRSDIAFERDFGPDTLPGTFDSRLLAQAFGNIIKNAAEAIDGREDRSDPGTIRVQSRRDGSRIRVDVIDNGKGLPRENRLRLLEPYMTTREKGTGLGLAIVKKIIEDHGGTLELNDAPVSFHGGKGAMITVLLPVAQSKASITPPGAGARTERITEKVEDGI